MLPCTTSVSKKTQGSVSSLAAKSPNGLLYFPLKQMQFSEKNNIASRILCNFQF